MNAPFGAPGVAGVIPVVSAGAMQAGKYLLALTSGFQQLVEGRANFLNTSTLGEAAPAFRTLKDLTNSQAVQLVSSTGTGTAAIQPSVANSAANYSVPLSTGTLTLTDSNAVVWPIVSNTATSITLAFNSPGAPLGTTPGSGAFTVQSTASPSVTILTDTPTGTAAGANAYMTDAGSPAYLVNQFQGQQLQDSKGQVFTILKNTAGVLTVLPNAGNQAISTSASAAYLVLQAPASNNSGQSAMRTVTSNTQVADSTDGTGSATSGVGSTPGFTPHTHVSWLANMFAGMVLTDSSNVKWLITQNSTTVLTVNPVALAGVPNGGGTGGNYPAGPVTGGRWNIATPAGASSIEIEFAVSGGSVSGSPTGLTAAAQSTASLQIGLSGATANRTLFTTGSGTLSTTGSAVSASAYTTGATAHALAGMWLSDGTGDFLILDNQALTTSANTGTITVLGAPASTPSTVLVYEQNPIIAGALASSAVSGTIGGLSVSATPVPTSPANLEFAVVSLDLI